MRKSQISISTTVDHRELQQTAIALKRFYAELQALQIKSGLNAQKISGAELKAGEADLRRRIETSKRLEDEKNRYLFVSGEKTKQAYIARLRAEEQAEGASYARRLRLRREAERLEGPSTKSKIETLVRTTRFGSGGGVMPLVGRTADALGVGGVGSVAAITAALPLIDRATKKAADLGETVNKTQVAFKGASGEILAWAKTTTDAIGVGQKKALDAAATFGLLFQQAAPDSGERAKIAKNLVQRAGDIVSLYNAPFEEVQRALVSGVSGEAEPLRRFGVFLSEAAVQAEALRTGLVKTGRDTPQAQKALTDYSIAAAKAAGQIKKYGADSIQAAEAQRTVDRAQERLKKATEGSTTQLTDQQKVMARLSLIMKQTEIATGDFAKTAKSAANQSRLLTDRMDDLETALGEKLLPLRTSVLSLLNGILDNFNKLPQATQNTAVGITGIGLVAVPAVTALASLVLKVVELRKELALLDATTAGTTAKAGTGLLARLGGASLGVLGPIGIGAAVAGTVLYNDAKLDEANSKRRGDQLSLTNPERIKFLEGEIVRIKRVQAGFAGSAARRYDADIRAAEAEIKTLTAVEKAIQKNQVGKKPILSATEPLITGSGALPNPATASSPLIDGAKRLQASKEGEAKRKKDQAETKRIGQVIASLDAQIQEAIAARSIANIAAFSEEITRQLERPQDGILSVEALTGNLRGLAKGRRDEALKKAEAKALEAGLPKKGDTKSIIAKRKELAGTQFDKTRREIEGDYQEELAKIDRQEVAARVTLNHLHQERIDFERDLLKQDRAAEATREQTADRAQAIERARLESVSASPLSILGLRNLATSEYDSQVRRAKEESARRLSDGLAELDRSREEALAEARTDKERRRIKSEYAKKLDALVKNVNAEYDASRMEALQTLDANLDSVVKAIESWDESIRAAAKETHDFGKQLAENGDLLGLMVHEAQFTTEDFKTFVEEAQKRRPLATEEQKRKELDYLRASLEHDQRSWLTSPFDYYIDPATGKARSSKYGSVDLNGQFTGKRVDAGLLNAGQSLYSGFQQVGRETFSDILRGKSSSKRTFDEIGLVIGDTAAQALTDGLVKRPLDRFFNRLGDRLSEKIKIGGEEAGAALAAAATAVMAINQAKKGKFGALLGTVAGAFIGGFGGAAIGGQIGGLLGFADGGIPPLNRAVRVGEDGPELAVNRSGIGLVGEYRPQVRSFSETTRIFDASTTRAIANMGGLGGGGGITINGPLMQTGDIHDRADAAFAIARVTEELTTVGRRSTARRPSGE